MAWERRRNRRVYFRAVKRNGRVYKTYFGCGPVARLAADMDAEERSSRLARHQVWIARRAALQAADDRIKRVRERVDVLVAGHLASHGYYPTRSEWRKRRSSVADTTPESCPDDLPLLAQRAQQGDLAAQARLRELMQGSPLLQECGDLARHAEAAWVDLITGGNELFRDGLVARLDQLKADLAGSAPSRLEQLLVDEIALCWLQTQHAAQLLTGAETAERKEARLAGQRQERAHRTYLAAVKQLAVVRKLLPGSG